MVITRRTPPCCISWAPGHAGRLAQPWWISDSTLHRAGNEEVCQRKHRPQRLHPPSADFHSNHTHRQLMSLITSVHWSEESPGLLVAWTVTNDYWHSTTQLSLCAKWDSDILLKCIYSDVLSQLASCREEEAVFWWLAGRLINRCVLCLKCEY